MSLYPEGRASLTDAYGLRADPQLYNADLAPTNDEQRHWSTYNYIALWFSMSMEVTTYMLASTLIAGGMNWKEAIGTILLGNLIVLIPMVLNAHAGAKYGIPFPVFVRASFGVKGANIPAVLRALVACGWFGIQSWIGGTAIAQMVNVMAPRTAEMPWVTWVCFFSFWALNMYVVWRGVESIRFLQSYSAPFMILMSLLLLGFILHRAGGVGPLLAAPSQFQTPGEFARFFFPALTGIVGYWATLSLNIPDFTRYAKSQDAQIIGQAFGLPVAMVCFSMLGIVCTSASTVIFGEAIWSPVALLGRFNQPLLAFLGLIALLVATLNVNIGANVVGPSNDFANLAPKFISFRTGGLITGAIGLLIMPWRLMSSSHNYLGWLVDYSAILGPVAGIMIADYIFLRKTRLNTEDLYHREGQYEYRHGINPRAVIALLAGVTAALIGRFVPDLAILFKLAWFVGFGVAVVVYLLLMPNSPRAGGATPLAQRIPVPKLDKGLEPAPGASASAKAI
jgi:NCS1 family nucleobase:cation symporter-1